MEKIILISIAFLLIKVLVMELRHRLRFSKNSIPEAASLAFRYKVYIQTDAKIAAINAIIKGNVIHLSYDACLLPPLELKALILHEVGHMHYRTNCEIMADHYALNYDRQTALGFICLTRRVLERDPQNEQMRARAKRAVNFYQRTYVGIPKAPHAS